MKVIVDDRTYKVSKLPPIVIARIQKKLESDFFIKSPSAKNKWLENVEMDGIKYAVMCKEESGAVVITNIRRTKAQKGLPWKRGTPLRR
jgi:hypothetical protein